jgi:hypothetical protein
VLQVHVGWVNVSCSTGRTPLPDKAGACILDGDRLRCDALGQASDALHSTCGHATRRVYIYTVGDTDAELWSWEDDPRRLGLPEYEMAMSRHLVGLDQVPPHPC